MAQTHEKLEEQTVKLNQSKVKMYVRCGEQYRRRYVENESIPPGIALIRGSAVHRGSQHNFDQKVDSHLDLPNAEVEEVAIETMRAKIENEGLSLNEDEMAKGKDAVVNEGQRAVRALTGLYCDNVAPRYQPILVEKDLELDLGNGTTLTGILDTVADDGTIVDLKTMSKAPSVGQYDADIQITNYWLLYMAEFNEEPKHFAIECLIDTKIPKNHTAIQTRQKGDVEAFVNLTQSVAHAIEAGVAIPAYGQDAAWWCSKKWCGYWATCPFVPPHRR